MTHAHDTGRPTWVSLLAEQGHTPPPPETDLASFYEDPTPWGWEKVGTIQWLDPASNLTRRGAPTWAVTAVWIHPATGLMLYDTDLDRADRRPFHQLSIDGVKHLTDTAHFQLSCTAWYEHCAPYGARRPHVLAQVRTLVDTLRRLLGEPPLERDDELTHFGGRLRHGYQDPHSTLSGQWLPRYPWNLPDVQPLPAKETAGEA